MGIVGASLLTAVTAYVAYDEFKREYRHAQDNLTILSEVLATGTRATFAAIDRGLELAAKEYGERLDARAVIDEDEAHRYLARIKDSVPYLRGLGWFDKDGRRVASSFGTARPPLDIAGAPNFETHRADARSGLFVGAPVPAKAFPGEWIVTVSRRVTTEDGAFAGVVNGIVDTGSIFGSFSDMARQSGITFALLHASGKMIVRLPDAPGTTGRDMSARPLFSRDLANADRGVSTATSPFQNVEVMRAFYKLPDLPIVVVVHRTVLAILADWRARQYANAIFVLGFIVAIIFGSAVLLRQYRHILRRQAELTAAKAAAEASDRAKSAFLSNMSHELRTPLNAVIGFGEIIAGRAAGRQDDAQLAEYAEDIVESGRRLLGVVNNVLDLSRIELSHFVLKMGDVAIDGILRASVAALRERSEAAGIEVATKLEAAATVRADAERLRQAFLNILDNAIRYTPRGGRVEIATSARSDGTVDIVIEDNGPGMTAEELEIARQPFGQVHAVLTRPSDGPGLGLSIAEHFIRLHGGTLAIHSRKGHGTRVAVRLTQSPRNPPGTS